MSNKAEKIKLLRKEAGMTQKKLADLLGISNRAVSKWETGLSMPSTDNLFRIAKIFNVSADVFMEKNDKEIRFHAADGMESMKELYKVGRGPSSSHTIGPENACREFMKRNPDADRYKAVLYGSLAKTGKGHGTDGVIKKTFSPIKCAVEFNSAERDIKHPNTLDLYAYKDGNIIKKSRVYSVGGGRIVFDGEEVENVRLKYSLTTFKEIAKYCTDKKIRLWQYAEYNEDSDFYSYMQNIWEIMKEAIHRGIEDDGILPGGLNVHKKAKYLYNLQHIDESAETKANRIVCSYAFAIGEQNAMGETIVTAPTCGAAGVLPAVLYFYQEKNGYSDRQIIHALETAGIIGNIIKTNASIAGAECGCQVEIGSACAMAAAALAELYELNIDKIEYAAEMAIEHHLGLTCDPICGLVQIPCIERNAVAAMRAINAVNLASFLYDTRKISFDKVVKAMKETGDDMSPMYKETSEGGLAKIKFEQEIT